MPEQRKRIPLALRTPIGPRSIKERTTYIIYDFNRRPLRSINGASMNQREANALARQMGGYLEAVITYAP